MSDIDRIAAVNTPGAHYIDGDREEWIVGENGADYPAPLLGRAPHIPGTDYYDGRDGSIETDEDDEETIADAEAHREDWQDYLEFQRTSH